MQLINKNMELILERKYKKEGYTIGNLYIAKSNSSTSPSGEDGRGAEWFCNSMEPAIGTATEAVTSGSRKAIATGSYRVKMQWSPKFGKLLPCLQDVPGRSSILIHAGNRPYDTQGCILVGVNTKVGMILNSRDCLTLLVNKIRSALYNGEEVKIIIK